MLGLAVVPLAAQQPANAYNVVGELEQTQGAASDHVIYVTNRSSETILVTSVRLMDCQNVQGNCGTIRRKVRILAGGRVMVHRVRPRFDDQAFGFRYTFTWEAERPEGPSSKDVAADPTVLEVDSLTVSPKVLDVQVGETVDLGQVLALRAVNKKGDPFQQVWYFPTITMGEGNVQLDGTKLTGKAVGNAIVTVAASQTAAGPPSTKAVAQVLITVIPKG